MRHGPNRQSFALEQEGIFADITTLAKGLGAGYQPIAAVMASESVVSAIQKAVEPYGMDILICRTQLQPLVP